MSRDIKVLHLESTDVCQASCALCARETDLMFKKNMQHHLTVRQVQKHMNDNAIKNLDKMFMCGNYGDPAAGKHTLELFQYFRSVNPNIVLGMNSNGGIQSTLWWHTLGVMLAQPQDYVVFSIDGLEDTNATYRRGVNWNKVMYNAQAFIAAGGSAHWDMLVYEHNQHQVDACEQLARDMGFRWFRAKVSKRAFISGLRPPTQWQPVDLATGPISCHALEEQSTFIDAQGRQSPCCWLGSTQVNFVKDIADVESTWNTSSPNTTCQITCSTNTTGTNFTNQWQRETQLN